MTLVVRRSVAIVLVLAVQAAAVSVPAAHVHPTTDDTAHHTGRSTHVHWSSHEVAYRHQHDGPAIEAYESDHANFAGAMVGGVRLDRVALAQPPTVRSAEAPAEQLAYRLFDAVSGHDPPGLRRTPARAPPVFPTFI